MDVPVEVAQKRMTNRLGLEKFEKDTSFINKLVENYRDLYNESKKDESLFGRIVRIDGNRPVEIVEKDIFNHFLSLYKEKFTID